MKPKARFCLLFEIFGKNIFIMICFQLIVQYDSLRGNSNLYFILDYNFIFSFQQWKMTIFCLTEGFFCKFCQYPKDKWTFLELNHYFHVDQKWNKIKYLNFDLQTQLNVQNKIYSEMRIVPFPKKLP
jgi:hypothetical protein